MKNSSSLSRRSLLKAGISTAAVAPLLSSVPSLAQALATTPSADTAVPVTIGGRLLATSKSSVPPYVIESDRGTGFLPIYLQTAGLDPSLLGQHVSVSGTLRSGACSPPALVMVNPTTPAISAPPSPFIPDCGATLLEIPLPPQEEATLQQILTSVIGAVFYNNDGATAAMFADQATQALTDPAFASYIGQTPFILVEDDTQCPSVQCYSFSDFVDLVAAGGGPSVPGAMTSLAPLAVSDECLRKIIIEILCLLLGLVIPLIPRAAIAEMERQAAQLITDPRVRQALQNLANAAQQVIAGTFRPEQFINVLISAMHAMAAPIGAAFLAVARTLRWAQAVIAFAASAGIILKAIILIAKGAMFIWKLIDIVRTCLGNGAVCPAPLKPMPSDSLAGVMRLAGTSGL